MYRDIPAFRFPVGHDIYTATYVTDVQPCRTWIMSTFITAISIIVEMERGVCDRICETNLFKIETHIIIASREICHAVLYY